MGLGGLEGSGLNFLFFCILSTIYVMYNWLIDNLIRAKARLYWANVLSTA